MATAQVGGRPDTKALLAGWRDAERRLYPLLLSSPEMYERSLRLVRGVADQLAAVATIDGLGTAYANRAALVASAVENAGTASAAVDVEAVVGAAFALRYAEIENEAKRAAAQAAVAAARLAGQPWVTLYESGVNNADGPVPPYNVLEACLGRPWGLLSSVAFDVDTDAVLYRVEVTRVDIENVQWWVDDEVPAKARTHLDVRAWQASRSQLRDLLLES